MCEPPAANDIGSSPERWYPREVGGGVDSVDGAGEEPVCPEETDEESTNVASTTNQRRTPKRGLMGDCHLEERDGQPNALAKLRGNQIRVLTK